MKRVVKEDKYYKVYNGDRLVYQTTEGVLLLHWIRNHVDTYDIQETINL